MKVKRCLLNILILRYSFIKFIPFYAPLNPQATCHLTHFLRYISQTPLAVDLRFFILSIPKWSSPFLRSPVDYFLSIKLIQSWPTSHVDLTSSSLFWWFYFKHFIRSFIWQQRQREWRDENRHNEIELKNNLIFSAVDCCCDEFVSLNVAWRAK